MALYFKVEFVVLRINMTKVGMDHCPAESSVFDAEGEENIEYLHAGDTSLIHVQLSMGLNTTDAMSTVQQSQITCTEQDFQQASYQQYHPYPLTVSESASAQSYEQRTTSTDTNELMDDDDNNFLFGMCEIEEFYADERWKKARLTESEQRLLVEELKSLLKNAPTSAHPNSKQQVLQLEYYNLGKLLEHLRTALEQSESIEIVADIDEEREREEVKEPRH